MVATKKRKLKIIGIVLIVFILISIIFFHIPITISHSKIEREQVYQTTAEWIDNHDYVLIAKVNKKVKTNRESTIPKTFYSIKQIAFIKGEKISDDSQICFYGGSFFLNFMNVVDDNDEFLKPKKYYLFLVNTQSEDSINFTLYSNKLKVLLKGYDEKRSYTNQKEEIQEMIDEYLNILKNEISTKFIL